ncbi:hypothetical protein ASPBRDRAFT_53006 [Aspergillus brasiliensis CBS 101740]|uniref:Uncharacterized protein n=1 Tax=Aspergillus brasiliensis (strain CBS 101740 / IMI 381727 / IBT 21946) TaxID=767769 RepID=A0A1L9UTS3_ASPBC|nr:hypothetical protein ASPBRDRAFT_53006 [Aspergillus brasiliensis CBS 101740]
MERPSRYLVETAPPTRGPAIFHHQLARWRVLALFPLAAACPPRMLLSNPQGPSSLVDTRILSQFRWAVYLGNMADGVSLNLLSFLAPPSANVNPLWMLDGSAAHLIHTPSFPCKAQTMGPVGGRALAPRLIVIFRFQTPGQTHLNGALTPASSDELGPPCRLGNFS